MVYSSTDGTNFAVVDLDNYSRYQLPDGRYVIVPIEWMDKLYVTMTASGGRVTNFGMEWDE